MSVTPVWIGRGFCSLWSGCASTGVGVWIDEGGIHGASLWGQEIVDAIESARVMVLMLSDASISSDNVVKELSIASEDKKPILPVYLHQAEIPKSMR